MNDGGQSLGLATPDAPPVSAPALARLERQLAEFEEQRERWELSRQLEQDRLRQEGTALMDAWQRLEDEQRRIFAERERLRSRATHAVPTAETSPQTKQEAGPEAPQDLPKDSSSPTATTWWQLEQLRLEMQKHAARA